MGNAAKILGTPLEDVVVFCPRCESWGVDTPVGVFGLDLATLNHAQYCDCFCPTCHWRFCGLCRSPSHPTQACLERASAGHRPPMLDDSSRAARMLQRRPPLPPGRAELLVETAKTLAEEAVRKARQGGIQKEDCAQMNWDFENLRRAFLLAHEADVRCGLSSCFGEVSLQPAPLAAAVQTRFMQRLQGSKVWPQICPGFHGTNACNHASIFNRGLLIPGDGNDLKVVHGAAYGRGIYIANANAAWLSQGFCSAPCMLVCAVLLGNNHPVSRHGDAMLVQNSADVIPLFEARSHRGTFTNWCGPAPVVAQASQNSNQTLVKLTLPKVTANSTQLSSKVPKPQNIVKPSKRKFLQRYAAMAKRH